MNKNTITHRLLIFILPLFITLCGVIIHAAAGPTTTTAKSYVGTAACKDCHADEYTKFITHSKMNHSYRSIELRKKGLTEAEVKNCYECHTTGFGKPGGFKSESETPELKNLGCETCHGPGQAHVTSGEAKDIQRKPDIKLCETCHNSSRVQAFNYKPVIYGGSH